MTCQSWIALFYVTEGYYVLQIITYQCEITVIIAELLFLPKECMSIAYKIVV